jgi:hypothetical protein
MFEEYYFDSGFGDLFFFDEEKSLTADPLIRERYVRYTGDDGYAALNMRALFDAVSAILTSDNGGFFREGGIPYLGIVESVSFIAYLVDVYSFETVIFMVGKENPDLVAIFGKDYETLRSEWIEYLNR